MTTNYDTLMIEKNLLLETNMPQGGKSLEKLIFNMQFKTQVVKLSGSNMRMSVETN